MKQPLKLGIRIIGGKNPTTKPDWYDDLIERCESEEPKPKIDRFKSYFGRKAFSNNKN